MSSSRHASNSAPNSPDSQSSRQQQQQQQSAHYSYNSFADESRRSCNVQVLIRCRPKNGKEQQHPVVIQTNQLRKEVTMQQVTHGRTVTMPRIYTFDGVFGPNTTQEDLYSRAIVPIVEEVLQGYNCTIFAYGQTSTGKTYTMEGAGFDDAYTQPSQLDNSQSSDNGSGKMDEDQAATEEAESRILRNTTTFSAVSVYASGVLSSSAGVIPRAIHQIFSTLEGNTLDYTIKVSCLELYNEELTDLLAPPKSTKQLRIFDDNAGKRGTVVQNLEEVPVKTSGDILTILDEASKRRRNAETQMNKNSSRSHLVTTITIHMKENTPDGEDLIKIGKLNLVDLAGSENIGRSGAQNQRAKEAGMINQSLLTLGRVITALTEHSQHIPYRESKLTRLLQDSLGGRTKTCIIATISPSIINIEETISTLEYAHRAKNIKNKPEANQKMSKKTVMKEMTADIERLKQALQAARNGVGFYITKEAHDEMELQLEQRASKIKELEEELEIRTQQYEEFKGLFASKEAELASEMDSHDRTKASLESANGQIAKLEVDLRDTKELVREKEFAIEEHKQTEDVLFHQADGMMTRLVQNLEDTAKLHSKIDRNSRTIQTNNQSAAEFQKVVADKITSFEQRLSDFGTEQSNIVNQLHESIQSLSQDKDRAVEVIRSNLEEAIESVTIAQKDQADMLAKQVENSASTIDELSIVSTDNFAQRIETILRDVRSKLTVSLSTVASHIEFQQAQALEMRQKLDEQVARMSTLCGEFASDHSNQLVALFNLSQELISRQQLQIQNHGALVENLHRQQTSQNAMLKERMIEKMRNMLEEEIRLHDQQREEMVSSISQDYSKSIQENQNFSLNFDEMNNNLSQNLGTFKSSFESMQEATSHLLQERIAMLDESFANHKSDVSSELQALQENDIPSIQKATSQHSTDIRTKSDGAVSELKHFLTRFQQSSEEKRQIFANQNAKIVSDLSDSLSSKIDARTAEASNQVSIDKSLCESFSNSQRQSLAGLKSSLGEFSGSIKSEEITGTTPPRRQPYSFPSRLAKSRPYSEMAEDFRSSKSDKHMRKLEEEPEKKSVDQQEQQQAQPQPMIIQMAPIIPESVVLAPTVQSPRKTSAGLKQSTNPSNNVKSRNATTIPARKNLEKSTNNNTATANNINNSKNNNKRITTGSPSTLIGAAASAANKAVTSKKMAAEAPAIMMEDIIMKENHFPNSN